MNRSVSRYLRTEVKMPTGKRAEHEKKQSVIFDIFVNIKINLRKVVKSCSL
jgi:hypothetical protein